MNKSTASPHAFALFSGGLDSILASRLIAEQGIAVTGLHFVSPFFGYPEKVAFWEKNYGITVRVVDVSDEFVSLLHNGPAHGFGKAINPCIDCKIVMLRSALRIMEQERGCCLISGEVLGQRPMSQRRDALQIIRRDAGVEDWLLRPLSAQLLEPTLAEKEGIIDRSRLLRINGRGRKDQLALAGRMGISIIPTPAGGCRLTEIENARSYWAVLAYSTQPDAVDFYLANAGRQLWNFDGSRHRLVVGRKQSDNEKLLELAGPKDYVFKLDQFAGPVGIGRLTNGEWDNGRVISAAARVVSFANKAVTHFSATGEKIAVRVHQGSLDAPGKIITVAPDLTLDNWNEVSWDTAQVMIKSTMRQGHAGKEK